MEHPGEKRGQLPSRGSAHFSQVAGKAEEVATEVRSLAPNAEFARSALSVIDMNET